MSKLNQRNSQVCAFKLADYLDQILLYEAIMYQGSEFLLQISESPAVYYIPIYNSWWSHNVLCFSSTESKLAIDIL